jgi:cardiolipin synthase C
MIRGATDSIDLEYFIYKNDTDPASRLLTQELIKKANEESKLRPGEKISVRILVDSSATVLKLKDEYASVLRENNIDVRYYNATESAISNFMKANQRNHRKSLIVDGREAITGGRNIGSEYFDLSPTYNFLDTDIYIKGSVAKVMQQSFESYWYSPLSAEPNYIVPRGKLGKKEPEYVKKMQKAYSLVNPNNTDLAFQTTVNSWGPRVLATQMRTICNDSTFVSDMPSDTKHSRRTFETIKQEVAKARKSLDIESPYFVITDVGSEIFRRLLQIPGFKLSVQTNSLHSTDASYTVAAFYPEVSKWTSQGVDMWIYKGEPPSFMEYPKYTKPAVWGIHSKRAVIDGHTTLIGTYNVDPRSSNLNNEMVYICHNNKDLADSTLKDMRDRQFLSVKLGPDGQPVDKSHVFQNASTSKKAQYLLLKKLVTIPALRELL